MTFSHTSAAWFDDYIIVILPSSCTLTEKWFGRLSHKLEREKKNARHKDYVKITLCLFGQFHFLEFFTRRATSFHFPNKWKCITYLCRTSPTAKNTRDKSQRVECVFWFHRTVYLFVCFWFEPHLSICTAFFSPIFHCRNRKKNDECYRVPKKLALRLFIAVRSVRVQSRANFSFKTSWIKRMQYFKTIDRFNLIAECYLDIISRQIVHIVITVYFAIYSLWITVFWAAFFFIIFRMK